MSNTTDWLLGHGLDSDSAACAEVTTTGDFRRLTSAVSTYNVPNTRRSSNFLGRIVGVVFMRVNSKCAHQVRPPLEGVHVPTSVVSNSCQQIARPSRPAGWMLVSVVDVRAIS